MHKILFFIMLPLVFYSCDPVSSNRKIVKNNTGYEILITEYSNKIPIDSFIIRINTEGIIFNTSGTGEAKENCNFGWGDSLGLKVINYPELKVMKDLNDINNWVFSKSGTKNKAMITECRAIITNSDIVPK